MEKLHSGPSEAHCEAQVTLPRIFKNDPPPSPAPHSSFHPPYSIASAS